MAKEPVNAIERDTAIVSKIVDLPSRTDNSSPIKMRQSRQKKAGYFSEQPFEVFEQVGY